MVSPGSMTTPLARLAMRALLLLLLLVLLLRINIASDDDLRRDRGLLAFVPRGMAALLWPALMFLFVVVVVVLVLLRMYAA